MKSKLYLSMGILIIALFFTCSVLYKQTKSFKAERNRYRNNTTALMDDIKRLQVDSITSAVDVNTLRLTVEEYKRYREEDKELIKILNIRIKSLETAARHQLEVNAPIHVPVTDTDILRDTLLINAQKIEMNTPHLQINGLIENNVLTGNIHLPVTLHQFVWIENKYRFLWWRWGVKAVHQTISSDNPHVRVKYSEYIIIEKK